MGRSVRTDQIQIIKYMLGGALNWTLLSSRNNRVQRVTADRNAYGDAGGVQFGWPPGSF
jgi:hypothetical protein